MATITYNRPKFLVKHQLDILNDPSDLICIEGGTKSGKTAAMSILAIEEALKGKPGDTVFWIAPVISQAKVGYDYIIEFLKDTALMTKDPTSGSQAVIYLCNGVNIKFIGNGEDKKSTNRIYNNRAIFVVVDEASRCAKEVFVAVESITTQTSGRICMIGNVLSRNNWFYIFCRRIENGEIPGSYYKITYRDAIKTGILQQERIDKIRQRMAPWEFASLYECEPIDDFKNPFGIQHINNCIVDYNINDIENVEFFGVDVGRYHDKSCIIGINEEGYIGVIDIFLNNHTLQRDRIKNVVGDSECYMDTTGITAGDVYYDELSPEMSGLRPYNFTSTSKKELISNLALYIQKGKVYLPSNQDILINELKNYELKISATGSVSFSNNSEVQFDDTVVSLAMACMASKDLCGALALDHFI